MRQDATVISMDEARNQKIASIKANLQAQNNPTLRAILRDKVRKIIYDRCEDNMVVLAAIEDENINTNTLRCWIRQLEAEENAKNSVITF